MAASWAMRRDGSFVVELFTPLNHNGKVVDHIIVQAPRYEHTLRWQREQIPSGFALLAELTGLPERLLRQVQYPDLDRMTIALFTQAKFAQQDIFEGKKPLASPDEQLPTAAESGVTDPVDPRFPIVDGPVRRFPMPPGGPMMPRPAEMAPQQPTETAPDLDLGLSGPEAMKAVR